MSVGLNQRPECDAPPAGDQEPLVGPGERAITAVIVGAPFLAVVFGLIWFWGRGVHLRDVLLAVALFFIVGHGITIGFHRMLAHRSFVACRPVKLALLALGSMAFQGGPIGWVADHRRHHVFSDMADDPHSPHRYGRGAGGQLRGLWHAQVGWLFTGQRTSWSRHAGDLLVDRDVMMVNALFPVWCVVSLAVPFGLGWLLGGSFGAALTALLWAGGVRIFFIHHVTWSVNSLCHTFGRRPFHTTDRSTNLAAAAILTMGESWHNGHHAFPRSARHGLLAGQWDSSALLIRGFERVGWARDVHQPKPEAVRRKLREASQDSEVRAPR